MACLAASSSFGTLATTGPLGSIPSKKFAGLLKNRNSALAYSPPRRLKERGERSTREVNAARDEITEVSPGVGEGIAQLTSKIDTAVGRGLVDPLRQRV